MTLPTNPFRRWQDPLWRRRWGDRLDRLTVPEALIGLAIVLAAAISSTALTRSPLGVGLAVVVGTLVHLVAFDTGNHSIGWLASSLVLVFALAGTASLFADVAPLGYTGPALLALAHNQTLELGHARRRAGLVDPSIPRSSVIGLISVGVVAATSIAVAQWLNTDQGRSWLWMALAAGLLTTVGVLLTWIPARHPNQVRGKRWWPGERLSPLPLSEMEIDDPSQLGPKSTGGTLV